MRFRLSSDLDVPALASAFARDGRVRIEGLLAAGEAEALHQSLRARDDWRQVIHSDGKVVELDRATRAGFDAARREALDTAVYAAARTGFQYRYEAIRVPDEAEARAASSDPLAAFAAFLSEGPARALLREITAATDIAFADAQGTAYSPGDFLTAHTDSVRGKHRRAAYVFGLTPDWRGDWGGLLLFHDAAGGELRGRVPGFNTLDLFRVPQPHSVSLVSPAAPRRRYSVTGWLRAAS